MSSLPPEAFERYDENPDEIFYETARLVTHIDDEAIEAVTQLYRDFFPPGGAILDLMSSWVSHLPREIHYPCVVGLGMNKVELSRNPQLTEYRVQNLNEDPKLPYPTASFDGAAICVSIQYLTNPVQVLCEAGRVLKPGAHIVITFSNRCFPTKAVAVWQMLDDQGRSRLVERYLLETGLFPEVQMLDRSSHRRGTDPLYAVVGRRAAPTKG